MLVQGYMGMRGAPDMQHRVKKSSSGRDIGLGIGVELGSVSHSSVRPRVRNTVPLKTQMGWHGIGVWPRRHVTANPNPNPRSRDSSRHA